MSEYTPTTDEVQFAAETSTFDDSTLPEGAFERWLNSVKAEAWDEGESAGEYNAGNGLASLLSGVEPPPPTENPYRTGGAE